MSSAAKSVRILREGCTQLKDEHRAFGDVINIVKEARNSTRKSIAHLILKSVGVGEAMGALFRDCQLFMSVVSCPVPSCRIIQ